MVIGTASFPGVRSMWREFDIYILEFDRLEGPYWALVEYLNQFGPEAYFPIIPTKFIGQSNDIQVLSDESSLWPFYLGYNLVPIGDVVNCLQIHPTVATVSVCYGRNSLSHKSIPANWWKRVSFNHVLLLTMKTNYPSNCFFLTNETNLYLSFINICFFF